LFYFERPCSEKIWHISRIFCIVCSHLVYLCYGHLVYFEVAWSTFSRFGTLYQ
jgi:hypothetical protein